MSTEPFVGIEQAAEFLAVKESYLYELCRLRKMPSYKVGKFRRFRLSELEAWAKGGNGAQTGQPGEPGTSDFLPARQADRPKRQ